MTRNRQPYASLRAGSDVDMVHTWALGWPDSEWKMNAAERAEQESCIRWTRALLVLGAPMVCALFSGAWLTVLPADFGVDATDRMMCAVLFGVMTAPVLVGLGLLLRLLVGWVRNP